MIYLTLALIVRNTIGGVAAEGHAIFFFVFFLFLFSFSFLALFLLLFRYAEFDDLFNPGIGR